MPQWAIAHDGSAFSTVLKLWMAAENQNEWSCATPRSKSFATVAAQDVAKWTVPSRSVGAPCSCWSCARLLLTVERVRANVTAITCCAVIEIPPASNPVRQSTPAQLRESEQLRRVLLRHPIRVARREASLLQLPHECAEPDGRQRISFLAEIGRCDAELGTDLTDGGDVPIEPRGRAGLAERAAHELDERALAGGGAHAGDVHFDRRI